MPGPGSLLRIGTASPVDFTMAVGHQKTRYTVAGLKSPLRSGFFRWNAQRPPDKENACGITSGRNGLPHSCNRAKFRVARGVGPIIASGTVFNSE